MRSSQARALVINVHIINVGAVWPAAGVHVDVTSVPVLPARLVTPHAVAAIRTVALELRLDGARSCACSLARVVGLSTAAFAVGVHKLERQSTKEATLARRLHSGGEHFEKARKQRVA